jgi:hypothetical protein
VLDLFGCISESEPERNKYSGRLLFSGRISEQNESFLSGMKVGILGCKGALAKRCGGSQGFLWLWRKVYINPSLHIALSPFTQFRNGNA